MRLVCVLLWLTSVLTAQTGVAGLTGIVGDPSGAAIPGCEIVINNTETGIVHRTRTNESGVYTAPSLNPGRYTVTFESGGFKKRTITGIVLQTGQEMRLNGVLEVGEVKESVEVEASATPLQQESAELSSTFVAKEIESLPINNRNPYSLLDLAPGVTATGDDPSDMAFNIDATVNGSRRGGTTFSVDGGSISHPQGYGERVGSIEALSEFKLYSHAYSSEFGRNSGAAVAFQVKSGTRQYHGSVYEFHRNSAFNANNWANNARGIGRTTRARHEYGATFGGRVPHTRNRMFFFASYEATADRTPVTRTRTIPEMDLRGGNFSRLPSIINDPIARTPFPGNIIPASRLDPAGVKLMSYFPEPNSTGTLNTRYGIWTNNWVRPTATRNPGKFLVTRTDYNPSDKDKLFVTFSLIHEFPRDEGHDFENLLTTYNGPRLRNMTRLSIGYTRFIRPNLTNELTLYAQRDPRFTRPVRDDLDVTQALGIQRWIVPAMPVISIGGGYGTYGNSNWENGIQQPAGISDKVTWLKGRHTLRTGVQVLQNQVWYISSGNMAGQYNFNGEITGLGSGGSGNPANALADVLLGAVKTATAPVPQIPVNRMNYNYSVYIDESWKATSKLTLSAGLRYEFDTQPIVKNNVYSRIDLNTGQLLVAGRNASRNLNTDTDYLNFGPRFGAAYTLTPKTVVRGGYGMFYATYWISAAMFGIYPAYPGWTRTQSFPDPGLGKAQAFRLSEGFPLAGLLDVPDPLQMFSEATPAKPLSNLAQSYPDDMPLPNSHQWNFTIQRALPKRLSAEIAYVASAGRNLARTIGMNNPTLDLAPRAVIDKVAIQQLRPFPNLGSPRAVFNDGRSDYHSLQVRADRRFHKGFSLTTSFTFSKNMDTVSSSRDSFQIPWQFPEIERALSSMHRGRMLSVGWVYELPFGKGKWLFPSNRVITTLLGGFQFNGIAKAADGMPATIIQNKTNTILSEQRPNVADPSNLSGRLDETVFAGSSRRWLIASTDPGFPFVRSSNIGIGNLGRNTATTPGYINFNFSLFRDFKFRERFRAQFRAEAYNAMNHVNYLGAQSYDLSNANYGLIANASPARNVQFGLRISF